MKAFWVVIVLITGLSYTDNSDPVTVYDKKSDTEITLFARNEYPYPVTIEMELELTNLMPSRVIPLIHVLPSKADESILSLKPIKPDKEASYATSYFYYMGDIHAEPDMEYPYRLPYRLGDTHRVTQGFDGEFSHKGNVTYSLDFDLDEGTAVYAARDGVVVELREDSDTGGEGEQFIDKANFVTIMHEDGTFADYSHLRKNGVQVRIGQKVRAGKLIAYSGSTGYVSGPHLHFNVKKVLRGGKYQTIPVKFRTAHGVVYVLEGESYQAY